MSMTPAQRQGHNLALALELAAKGYYIFPSNNKTPLCAVWQRADDTFNAAEREAAVIAAAEKNGFNPLHVGATKTAKVIKDLWKKYPDSVPSISCGPSGLFVIDADVNDGKDGRRIKQGPLKLATFFAENEIPMEGVFTVASQSGGRHVYYKNNEALGSAAGILRDLDCDTRGIGGQTVAPGAITPKGNTYTILFDKTLDDLASTPDTPAKIVTAARTQRETTEVSDKAVADSISKLEDAEIAPYSDLFDPVMGYDLDALAAKDEEFASLFKLGTGDISRNRFKITRCLMREFKDMPIEHLISFHSGWLLEDGTEGAGTFNDGSTKKGSGEFNYRDVAREHAKGNSEHKVSDGAHLGDVTDQDDRLPPEQQAIKDKKLKEKHAGKWWERITKVPFDLDIDKLPPRPVIYGNGVLQLGEITLVSGASGKGKSAYTLSLAVDIACGVDHLGQGAFRARKVMMYNAEDSLIEMLRRIGAYMFLQKFTPEMRRMVSDNLSLLSGKDGRIKLASSDGRDVKIEHGAFATMKKLLIAEQVQVLVLDPLVATHDINENDNTGMGALVSEIGILTFDTQVATVLVHHDKKGLQTRATGEASMDDARGAGAIVSSVRMVLNVGEIKKSDAGNFEIESTEVWKFMAVSQGAKANYSARDPNLKIYRQNSVIAENGTEEFKATSTVGLTLHNFKPKAAGLSDSEMGAVFAEIDKIRMPVGTAPQHPRYLGKLIAEACDLDWGVKKTRETAKATISDWLKRKLIAISTIPGQGSGAGSRRPVDVYVRGEARSEGRDVPFEAVQDED
jgi:hypothetical protein